MNLSSRMKNLMGSARRHSWSHIIQVPLYSSEDEEKNNQNGNCPSQRIGLTIRQPSFSFISSDPAFKGKLVTKNGETLTNQKTVVFEPNFDRKISEYSYVDVMKSLRNKSIYSDLSNANSANEDNKEDEETGLSLSLTLSDFSQEAACSDLFTDPDDDFEQLNESFYFNSKIPKRKNSQIVMELRQLNAERWNNIGYVPPDII